VQRADLSSSPVVHMLNLTTAIVPHAVMTPAAGPHAAPASPVLLA
jgi:hypothetical protein